MYVRTNLMSGNGTFIKNTNNMRYKVELRPHDDEGAYIEEFFEFTSKAEAMKFAYDNYDHLYSVYDYEDRDHDPIDITP